MLREISYEATRSGTFPITFDIVYQAAMSLSTGMIAREFCGFTSSFNETSFSAQAGTGMSVTYHNANPHIIAIGY